MPAGTGLDRVIDAIHPHLGKMILKHWEFAPELIDVPRLYRRYTRDAEAADYVDVVCVADILISTDFANDPEAFTQEQPNLPNGWQTPSCFERLNFDPNMAEYDRAELLENITNAAGVFV